ncbi:hypothetical protein [Sphingomonas sp. BE137]|uniref:hypothetical protein n=1 Tax=Sphingomonas sp. BE137 TaxID=2817844 RepID=UPI001AE704E7|nr:hypothetical protein [Sphingomonas sp. BE137]MDR6850377.1 putative RecB family endonuclease [Sphingomonas sp. BE137]
MTVLALILAASLIMCGVMGAVAYAIRRTTISVVIRKDPDMATIKERLAALEAQAADHSDALTSAATKDEVAALATRVDGIDAEIGADPAPAATAATPVATDPASVAAASPFA